MGLLKGFVVGLAVCGFLGTASEAAATAPFAGGMPGAGPQPGVSPLAAKSRATVAGSVRPLSSGKLLVQVTSNARAVVLVWRTSGNVRRAAVMAVRRGKASGLLPRGSLNIVAQARATGSLQASVEVPLPLGDTTPPGPVGSLAVAGVTASSISLSWVNPGDADLAGVVVRRAEGAVAPASATAGVGVPLGGAVVQQAVSGGLTSGATYSFAVFAVDTAGNASVAASVKATTTARGTQGALDLVVSAPLTRADVPYSYRPGCPVEPAELRRVSLNYWNFAGELARGDLIVRADVVDDIQYTFAQAFAAGFRIKQMVPTDAFYDEGRRAPAASDVAAMTAGNTSAFNCRPVVGNPTKPSAHAFGFAIDINPIQNPYILAKAVLPVGSAEFVNRWPCRMGMVCPGDVIATAWAARGWQWGARWAFPDYQHFSANGR